MLGSLASAVGRTSSYVMDCESDSDACIGPNVTRVENTCLLRSACMGDSEAKRGLRRFSISRDIIVDDIHNKGTSDTHNAEEVGPTHL